MKQYGISYILKLLNISPSKMSQTLNIDRTLVSKWKNAKRNVDINNEYFDKLIDYLLLVNTHLGINSLEIFFRDYYNLKSSLDNNLTKKYLITFIMNPNQITLNKQPSVNGITTVPVTIYNGLSNSRSCILDLLDTTFKYVIPCKLTFIYCNVLIMFMEDKEFRILWYEKLLNLLNNGFQLDLIISSYKCATEIINFTALLLHDKFNLLYSSTMNENPESFSIHHFNNKFVLLGVYNNSEENYCNYSALYQDSLSISAYTNIVHSIKSCSKPLLQSITHSDIINNYSIYDVYSKQHIYFSAINNAYYYNCIPTYLVMSEDLFYEVLTQSTNCKSLIDSELHRYKQSRADLLSNLSKNKVVHFYPLNNLYKLSKSEKITYSTDYLITTPPLTLTNSQFKRHLNDLVAFNQTYNNFHVCLTDLELEPALRNFHIWCRKNEIFCMFSNENPEQILISEDMTFVNSIADGLDRFLQDSQPDLKSSKNVAHILTNL